MGETIEIKAGFKQTKLGWIPQEWNTANANDLCHLITNGFVGKAKDHYTEDSNGVLYIQGYNVKENSFNFKGVKRVTQEFHQKNKKSNLQEFDLLTVQTGDVGLTTIIDGSLVGSNCHALIISRFKQDACNPKFYSQYYNSYIGRSRLKKIETGTTMKHINVSDLKKFLLPLPPLPEQKKIADILSTWDKTIETTQALIDKLQLRKKGLMQQLLTGKKRLPGFSGEWEVVKLRECAQNESVRNKNLFGSEKLYGVNKRLGLIPMKEQVKGKNFDRCKIVKPKWFAYNPMRINIGSIVQHNHTEELMVSGDYVVFSCNEEKLLAIYLNLFRRGHIWNQFMLNAGNGSVRIRIYFKDLGFLKIPLPSVKEQTAIAQVLTKADEEINGTQNYLQQLQEQKKGLMQQLLTGQKRVIV